MTFAGSDTGGSGGPTIDVSSDGGAHWTTTDHATVDAPPDGGNPGEPGLAVTVTGVGTHTLYYVVDGAGNAQVGFRVCVVPIAN